MRRIVFREGLHTRARTKALDIAKGWGVSALLVAPRTYHLTGPDGFVDAVASALARGGMLETPEVGET